MRQRSIWHEGQWMPAAQYYALRDRTNQSDHPAPLLMRDIDPYRSMATGETITSRSQHRQHLKEHGLVELGNERLPDRVPYEPEGIEEDIRLAHQQIEGGAEVPMLESEIIPED